MNRRRWVTVGVVALATGAFCLLTLVPINSAEPVATKIYATSVEASDHTEGCASQSFSAWLRTREVTPVLNVFGLALLTDVEVDSLDSDFRQGELCADGTAESSGLDGLVGITVVGEPQCDSGSDALLAEAQAEVTPLTKFDAQTVCDGSALIWASGSEDPESSGVGRRSGDSYALASSGLISDSEWCLTFDAYFLPSGDADVAVAGERDGDSELCVAVEW